MNPTISRMLYAILAILGAGAAALIPLFMAGSVPIPKEWAWAAPVVVAMLIALTAMLPKAGNERLDSLASEVGRPQAEQVLKAESERQQVDAVVENPDVPYRPAVPGRPPYDLLGGPGRQDPHG
jgi:hypothetical protein